MVAGQTVTDNEPLFTIENNVLKGKVVPCRTNYTSVGALALDGLKKNPQCVGQVDPISETQDTFAEMLDRVVRCALWMKKQGVKRGDIIAISTHNHLNSFVPCVAALCVGAIFNPWDHDMNIQVARHFISLSVPKIVFANESSAGVVLEAAKIEVLQPKMVVFGYYPGTTPFTDVLKNHSDKDVENFKCTDVPNAHSTAVIMYSSGTTGLPKGVQLTHFGLLNFLNAGGGLDLTGQIPLWFSSLYWITGTLLTLQSITTSTKRIVYADFDGEITCQLIEKYQVSWLFLGTSMANRLVKAGHIPKYDLSSLKFIFTGGALLKPEAEEELRKNLPGAVVLQAYGMTELGGLATSQMSDSTSGSCGVVVKNTELKVIDTETGQALGPNQHGEVCIKTLSMCSGYYKNPEATKGAIDEEGWLHSGDLGYYNDKGELFIIERLKELIKYRGRQISPGEIENLLQSHSGVLEAAVIGVPHSLDDEHPIAFISRVPGTKVTAQELTDLVAHNLMDHNKLRAGVKFLQSLPHTASGKISRKELRALAKSFAV